MPLSHFSAVALRERLLSGQSVMDQYGNECPVPPKRRRAPVGPVPSVEELMGRYEPPGEGPDPYALIGAIRRATGTAISTPERMEPIDLAPFAAMAGMAPETILSLPDEPPPVIVDSPRRRALTGARVPDRFADLILDAKVRETEPVRDVREWLKAGTWAIGLGGERGTGKTMAACVGLVESGGGLFVTAEELVSPDGRDLREAATAAPFLALDEMGDEALTDIGLVQLRAILGKRHKDKLRTAFTGNLTLLSWAERYGGRLVDWLREGGGFKAYTGQSLRVRA